MHDVQPQQYPSVIREMTRHENDVTNHRIMWLLVGQGFIANAYINEKGPGGSTYTMLALAGILVAVSAFVMLYKSYQARGYLEFLGLRAKQGTLEEENLPMMGWPRNRIPGWRKEDWFSPWLAHARDLLEPWLFLPSLFMFIWTSALLQGLTKLDTALLLIFAALLTAATVSVCAIVFVWTQGGDEERTEELAR